jgi:hypothetical protein
VGLERRASPTDRGVTEAAYFLSGSRKASAGVTCESDPLNYPQRWAPDSGTTAGAALHLERMNS